jgi:deoxycytidine triphosphate deaminase
MSVVSGEEVATYCKSYVKINPNGVDLAPIQVSKLPMDLTILLQGEKRGYLGPGNKLLTEKETVLPDESGFYLFERGGMFELRFPGVRIPPTCTGFAFPRSSINRLGIIKLESAVFDSGYEGEPTQVIFTPISAKVHTGEALVQLVLIRNEKPAKSLYGGYYQGEKGTAAAPTS